MGACETKEARGCCVTKEAEAIHVEQVHPNEDQQIQHFTPELTPELRPEHSVFSWLEWGPERGSPCYQALRKYFPGALPGRAVVQRVAAALSKYGLDSDNTIYGQSICPDEINNLEGGLAFSMADYWGKCFPMGGIGGAPFVGQTGFAAFSNHVPDNGHVLLLFGPHIAISETGKLGKCRRYGQSKESTACGAVLAAHSACKSGHIGEFDPKDMQQSWLKEKINDKMERIEAAEDPYRELIGVAYELVREKILTVVNNDFGDGHLVILGGVQLNMPWPCLDYFAPLMFELRRKDGSVEDLMSTFNFELCSSPDEHPASNWVEHCRVFSWLQWSPPTPSPCFATLERCFPGALPGQAVRQRTQAILAPFGLNPQNTIYGQSLCPDEINGEKGGLAHSMAEVWGECFPMGGIGGAPFVGKTGFSAFSNHVPDDGHVLILFGPHIAISESGELGKHRRFGQSKESTACGAVLGAHSACCGDKSVELDKTKETSTWNPNDMQLSWLKEEIAQKMDRISSAADPYQALVHVAYESIYTKLSAIVNNEFGNGHLVLLGGIQINMPYPCKDHFLPLFFELRTKKGSRHNLMEAFSLGGPAFSAAGLRRQFS